MLKSYNMSGDESVVAVMSCIIFTSEDLKPLPLLCESSGVTALVWFTDNLPLFHSTHTSSCDTVEMKGNGSLSNVISFEDVARLWMALHGSLTSECSGLTSERLSDHKTH